MRSWLLLLCSLELAERLEMVDFLERVDFLEMAESLGVAEYLGMVGVVIVVFQKILVVGCWDKEEAVRVLIFSKALLHQRR